MEITATFSEISFFTILKEIKEAISMLIKDEIKEYVFQLKDYLNALRGYL